MTEPTRKIDKDQFDQRLRLVEAPAREFSASGNPLRWWTSHSDRPGEINLQVFATGMRGDQVRANMLSGFSGRAELIGQLAPYIKLCYANAPLTTVANLNPSLRTWWRILDECEEIAPVRSIVDLNEIHNAAFLRIGKNTHKHYNTVMNVIRVARQDLGYPPLYWTSPERSSPSRGLIDPRAVSQIYHQLKRRCFEALHRFAEKSESPPSRDDVSNLLVMFLLRTGWNLQTALDIDISARGDGELSCYSPHPTSRDHHIITSSKARAQGREQFALGTNKSQLSPGNIILALVRQTLSVRESLHGELDILRSEQRGGLKGVDSDILTVQIKKKKAMLKSPWLFEAQRIEGQYRYMTSRFATSTGSAYMATLTKETNNGLRPGEAAILQMSLSDLRDAYIEAQYARSGYSWLTAMLAAQHSSVYSIAAYLRKRQYKAHSESRFLSVTEKIWDMAAAREPIDPIRVAAQIEGASAEQILRWQVGKDRTRVGMGCRDFYNPPKEIAPAHLAGNGCRVQRCTLCSHGIVFTDSAEHIARRVEELKHIHYNIPLLSWVQSTFPEELERAENILETLCTEAQRAHWRDYWQMQINSGKLLPLSGEGSNG